MHHILLRGWRETHTITFFLYIIFILFIITFLFSAHSWLTRGTVVAHSWLKLWLICLKLCPIND